MLTYFYLGVSNAWIERTITILFTAVLSITFLCVEKKLLFLMIYSINISYDEIFKKQVTD